MKRKANTLHYKKFRYGTELMFKDSPEVHAKFPKHSIFPLVNPDTSSRDVRPFPEIKAVCDRQQRPHPMSFRGYQSISTVIGVTSDYEKLYQWQLDMVVNIGIDEFKKLMNKMATCGTKFHSVVKSLLQESINHGCIVSTIEEILTKQEPIFKSSLRGFLSGLYGYLRDLKPTEYMRLEEDTYHPILYYRGRFDAILEIDGEPTLVDWKTVNNISSKSSSNQKLTLADLYNDPVQVAAYVAAVNSDPAYSFLPPIKRAAIVLAYEDGRKCEVIHMGEEDIERYFDEFCRRINQLWWQIEHKDSNDGRVNVVYSPPS